MKVVTVTMNPALDVSTRIGRVVSTHKLRCENPRYDPGGGGINVARAIRTLGGEALALFTSGRATGELLEEVVAREGVEYHPIPVSGLTRENLTVLETETGEEYRFVMPGPDLGEEWQTCLEQVCETASGAEYLVMSGSLPPGAPEDFYGRLAREMKHGETRTVLDTSGRPLWAALEEGVYLVKPNRKELEEAAGEDLDDPDRQEELSRELVREGRSRVVALTLGAEGALLTWEGGSRRVRPPAVETRSSVGAGDSFVAGMVLGLTRGLPLEDAFCLGVSAGTAALITPGTELCKREDTERLHGEMCRERNDPPGGSP